MLFSDPQIADFITSFYIPAWESVRPVPVVDIDFGNGSRLKRTINGNIATYLCMPDGRVLDVIPGLNDRDAYIAALENGITLWSASKKSTVDPILVYHRMNQKAPHRFVVDRLDVGKAMVESRIKYRLVPLNPEVAMPHDGSVEATLLAADTEINRKERKPLIHAILAEKAYRPADLTKRLYKDVLHVDLDDPYLGLVTAAFGGGAYGSR